MGTMLSRNYVDTDDSILELIFYESWWERLTKPYYQWKRKREIEEMERKLIGLGVILEDDIPSLPIR